jgi:hypothetical protein
MAEVKSREREEALRILYRLRREWHDRDGLSPSALRAIQSLIDEYEREHRTH